jgi:integral membrane sensor domain MASE1
MNGDAGVIAPLVQAFFADYLVRQRRVSPQTVSSYRDTFRVTVQVVSAVTGPAMVGRPDSDGSVRRQ